MYSPNHQAARKAVEVADLAPRFRQASKVIAFLVTTLGVVVLCGWVFNLPTLTYIRPTLQSMKVNTALSFLCLGAGLWLADNDERQRSRRILGLLVVIVAGSTLAEYAFRISLGIDQLLLPDTRTPSLSAYPGRMAIATAICFLLLGSALMLLGLKKALVLQRSLVVACFAFSLVALCGYLYGVGLLYSITPFSTMGVHTAAGLMAASLAYFLARTNEGIVSIAASDSNSGFLLRMLVPAIIVVPILLGWLRHAGQRANLYDTPFGTALLVVGSIGCLAVLTMLVARSMYRSECESSHAEKTLHESGERFRLAAQAGKMYAYEWDVATDMVMQSEEHVSVLGFSEPRRLTRQELLASVHPEDRPLFVGSVDHLTPQNPTTQISYRVSGPDGSIVWLEKNARGFFDAQGKLLRVIGMVANITERKRAEEALRESEDKFRLLLDSTAEAIYGIDLKHRCTFCNPACLRILDTSTLTKCSARICII
jgi:PAS domain S-box-containing protein